MDLDDFRMILSISGADVWDIIDAAVTVASLDYADELKDRRDGIVERLYANSASRCRNCDVDRRKPNGLHDENKGGSVEKENSHERFMRDSPSTPQSIHRTDDDDDEGPDPYGGGGYSIEDEKTKIIRIKELLEDPDQSEDSLLELLQTLAEMEITFQALQETDIGRHVNRLRKHSSNEVRLLVKQLVRQWKDIVDEWVQSNTPPNKHASSSIIDDDSPQQNAPPSNNKNIRKQVSVPDFAYSPNPHNGRSGSDKSNSEPEPKSKAIPQRRDVPKQPQSVQGTHSAPPNRPQKESNIDMDKLASARKRLQENYQEAQNARKQRKIQVMDIHEIPKPKNTFFSKNKGGSQGRR